MSAFLQCDAVGCDHVEDVDAIKAEYIGRACPKCGANLLTQQDFDNFQPMAAAILLMKQSGFLVDADTKDARDIGADMVVFHTHDGESTVKFVGERRSE